MKPKVNRSCGPIVALVLFAVGLGAGLACGEGTAERVVAIPDASGGGEFFCHELVLEPGWNLISIPAGLADNSVQGVLGQYVTGEVWQWSEDHYRPVTVLTPNCGYWAYHTGTAAVTIPLVSSVAGQPPVAQSVRATVAHGLPVTVDVLTNDADPDAGKTLRLFLVSTPAKGTVRTDGGRLVYTPGPSFSGSETFAYVVADGRGRAGIGQVTVADTPNSVPVAKADSASTVMNAPVKVYVLSNDADTDGDALTVSVVTDGQYGRAVRNADNTVTYTPQLDWSGNDTFTYRASDGFGGTADADVAVEVRNLGGLQITAVTHVYSSPYLLDFGFSLRDGSNHAVVTDPAKLGLTCSENDDPISPTETGSQIIPAANKQLKCFLVLDYTNSMNDQHYGDDDHDGIGNAVEAMETSAKAFLDALSPDAQVGVIEFHREEPAYPPAVVSGFTSNKTALKAEIDTIWANYVRWFPASTRCWDAVYKAIEQSGNTPERDEERFVVFLSDGVDESSLRTPAEIIAAANARSVRVFCIGFGKELPATPTDLQNITSQTGGQYYPATSVNDLMSRFQEIVYDLQGQYILRWATLRRKNESFTPKFRLSFLAYDATYTGPGYNPTDPDHAGDVLVGSLRFVADPIVGGKTKLTLRSVYTPRYIRRLRFRLQSNYLTDIRLIPRECGGLCGRWTLTQSPDGAGGLVVELRSPNPDNIYTAIPFAVMGPFLEFRFERLARLQDCFARFEADNSIYQTTGGQSFAVLAMKQVSGSANLAPVAVPDSASAAPGEVAEIDVLKNDSDPDDPHEALRVAVVTQGVNGGAVAVVREGRAASYTATAGFTGTDTFTYTITDGYGGTSQPATVTVSVGNDYLVVDLSAGSTATSYPVEYRGTAPLDLATNDGYRTTKLLLRRIAAGEFTMGSPAGELGRDDNETRHTVALTQDLFIGVFEVTQRQWTLVSGTDPSNFKGNNKRPVEQVSWNDVRGGTWPGGAPAGDTFMGRLRQRTGLSFDLPTEAQWEYACRAGTTTALNSGRDLTSTEQDSEMDKVGRYWFNGGSNYQADPVNGAHTGVGLYAPNAWGLYDLHGNVWEWCLDWYQADLGTARVGDPVGPTSGSRRVLRGGAWSYGARYCRSAHRYWYTPANRSSDIGFRLALPAGQE